MGGWGGEMSPFQIPWVYSVKDQEELSHAKNLSDVLPQNMKFFKFSFYRSYFLTCPPRPPVFSKMSWGVAVKK